MHTLRRVADRPLKETAASADLAGSWSSDGRSPTGRNEVILRRTIGANKADYTLDRKTTTEAEEVSPLDSAGFSRSNSLFISPRGRLTSPSNQKDSERPDLLKEIAGTRVYEDRKKVETWREEQV